jgi:hypothetical protein
VEAADVARTPAPPGKFRRVIWIGLDGADWVRDLLTRSLAIDPNQPRVRGNFIAPARASGSP